MRLNQKVRYGVACLYELSRQPEQYIETELMSHHQHIPLAYAHKVLQAMAHAGLVHAVKGMGYKLSRPLSEISAYEAIEALTKDVDPNASNPDMGVRFEKRINQALEHMTLGELCASL